MNKLSVRFFSILIFVLLWGILSLTVNSPLILPSPLATAESCLKLFSASVFWKSVFFTFLRVISAFLLAAAAGTFIGVVSGRLPFAEVFLDFPLSLLKSTPLAAMILLLLFAFDSNIIPIIAAFLMSLPVMAECTKKGTEKALAQKKLYKMAKIYGFSKKQKFLFIFFPEFKSSLYSGLLSTFGMCWKAVVAGEILTLPKTAIGTFLYRGQINLETAEVLGSTVLIIVLSHIMERILKWILK